MDPSRPPAPDDVADLARRGYQVSHLPGTCVLRSGATSGEYFDKYRFESDPRLLRELAEAMAGLLPGGADGLAGLEVGGGRPRTRPAPAAPAPAPRAPPWPRSCPRSPAPRPVPCARRPSRTAPAAWPRDSTSPAA